MPRQSTRAPSRLPRTRQSSTLAGPITAIAVGDFVLARRFAVEPDWGFGWTVLAAGTGC